MSLAVSLDALQEKVQAVGPAAYLVTVDEAGLPHVVSVGVRWEDDRLLVGAGRSSVKNVAARPGTTLLWPPADGEYSLIVDGTGEVLAGPDTGIAIRPSSAVLHRTADASGSGPRCLPVTGDS
jgi:Pyridoxamine 5'-phosphate oxidase